MRYPVRARRLVFRIMTCLVAGLVLSPTQAAESKSEPLDRQSLPIETWHYDGTLGPTEASSTPQFPVPVRAPKDAPNIVLVLTDDVGFGSASTFGGSIPTPNLDQLAANGLTYTRFHTTGVCSPTRAALLTGRNHHQVSTATVVEVPSPYPGYVGEIPPSAVAIARILRDNGYSTAMFGKDHNVPMLHRSGSGPFQQWPTGRLRGFDYFFGFVAGDTNQWQPALHEGTTPLDSSTRAADYLLDAELADRAIHWLRNQHAAAPDTPFFMYYAPGSAHAPHHAPPEWIAKFKGKFDHGWDEERAHIVERQKNKGIIPSDTRVSPRPDVVPAWDSLTAVQKKVYARFMEVYAAQLAHQDAQFGRVLAELERMHIADNTLVIFIQGDNGSSGEAGATGTLNELVKISSGSEHHVDLNWLADNLDLLGGPSTYQGYQLGWTWATNAPFPWFKQIASHLGGTRNGMVISWPKKIKRTGEIRTQFHHVIDVVPTLLEAAALRAPATVDGVAQKPLDGNSMIYSFDDPRVPSARTTQYFEINGDRGIYHDGWLASTSPRNMPWHVALARPGSDVLNYPWELYDLRSDFAQAQDLALEHPKQLARLKEIFDQEARRNNVYPLHDTGAQLRAARMLRATANFRTEYEFFGSHVKLQMLSAPPIFHLPFTIEFSLNVADKENGVMIAAGSHFGGWSFYLIDGRPAVTAAISPLPGGRTELTADAALRAGKHRVIYKFVPEGKNSGTVQIMVDNNEVLNAPIHTRPPILASLGETFDIGQDTNAPVSNRYQNGGHFGGTIERVRVKLTRPKQTGSSYVH